MTRPAPAPDTFVHPHLRRVRLVRSAAARALGVSALVSCAVPESRLLLSTPLSSRAASSRQAPPLPAARTERARASTLQQTIDDVVAAALSRAIAPGAVVAIVLRDSVGFMKAYGRTGDATAPALTADAVFEAGPVAQLVSGLAAARLGREGKVRLDAPVRGLVPELPEVLGSATLAQLLTHTAGLAVVTAVRGRGGADDLGAAARQLTHLDRIAAPGSLYSRSSNGIALAGLVLERAAGRPYAQLMRATVLEPLRMTHSTFDFATASPQLTPGFRASQSPDAQFLAVAHSRLQAVRVPIDGLYATAGDLARLALALLNDGMIEGERLLPEGVAADVLRARATVPVSGNGVGLGVHLVPWQGRQSVRIAGSGSGHSVLLHLLPEFRLGVLVLTNKSGATLSSVAEFVFRNALRVPEPQQQPPPAAAAAPPDSTALAELASYPGDYLNGSELIEIVVEDGRARLKSGDLMLDLRPLTGGAVGAVLEGQTVLRLHLLKDERGRPYLWIGDRALGRRER